MTTSNTILSKKPRTSFATCFDRVVRPVIHRQKNAEYIQTRIKVSLNPLHRIKKLRNTLESVELTLDGDEQLIGSNKGIDRQETQ